MLGQLCVIELDFVDADFWIIANGPRIGEPVKVYNPAYIGVKVVAIDVLVPQYLYYWMMNLWMQGAYQGLQNIVPEDLQQIPVRSA